MTGPHMLSRLLQLADMDLMERRMPRIGSDLDGRDGDGRTALVEAAAQAGLNVQAG